MLFFEAGLPRQGSTVLVTLHVHRLVHADPTVPALVPCDEHVAIVAASIGGPRNDVTVYQGAYVLLALGLEVGCHHLLVIERCDEVLCC